MASEKISVVAIKPNGRLAGYFPDWREVGSVIDYHPKQLMRSIETGEVYFGLKWMREEDFQIRHFRGDDLSFPVPDNYDVYLRQPLRMSKERMIIEQMKLQRIENLKRANEAIERMRKKRRKRERLESNICVQGPAKRVGKCKPFYCVETGKRYDSIQDACFDLQAPYSTIWGCLHEGGWMKSKNVHLKYVMEEE